MSQESKISFNSWTGVDLHLKTVTLCSVDREGNVLQRLTCATKCVGRIRRFIASQPRPCHLVIETMGSVEWFVDRFESLADRTDLADATALANLRGKRRKTDRNDAHDIAWRASRGECPLAFLADAELREFRKLTRHWHALSKTLSTIKIRMRWILHGAGLQGPKPNGGSGQRWLLAHGHRLNDTARLTFRNFLELVQLIELHQAPLKRQIIAFNRRERFAPLVQLIQTVPGIKVIHAAIIVAQVGDFANFPNADTLDYWVGLTPDNKSSAGRTQSGKITKAGNATLRWALGKAALCMARSDPRQKAIRKRLLGKIGKAKANVAMARRLVHILYAMARDKKPFERTGSTNHNRKAHAAKKRRKAVKKAA
jgi:transposase